MIRFKIRFCLVLCFILLSCQATTKEKDFIIANHEALKIFVPSYLNSISIVPPALSSIDNLEASKVGEDEKKEIIQYLRAVKRYENKEREAIELSIKQFFKASEIASEEAKK